MRIRHQFLTGIVTLVVYLFIVKPVNADRIVTETTIRDSTVVVHLTNRDGNINSNFDQVGILNAANNHTQQFTVPKVPGLVDVRNTTTAIRTPRSAGNALADASAGETADLSLESVGTSNGQFIIDDLFTTIEARVGFGVQVSVPDLFADTNGDGILGEGDILYSLVNIDTYLDNLPSFSLGDAFAINDGIVSSLPGMMFSSTPFVFSAGTGFTGTPFTGPAVVETVHIASSEVPEPSSFWIVLATAISVVIRSIWTKQSNPGTGSIAV